MKNIIYGLKDPRNDVYYYIGKSTVGNERALSHLTKSHSKKVEEWVNELGELSLYPKVDIIEEVIELNDLAKKESEWIKYYFSINPNLLNINMINTTVEEIRADDADDKFYQLCHSIFYLPELIRKERNYRKLTQDQLSKETGISRSTLSLLERGGNITIDVVKSCLLALKNFDLTTNVHKKRVRTKKTE